MEKTSSNTLSPSTLSLADFLIFILYDIFVNWVIEFKKFYSSSRCFFQSHVDFFYYGSSKKLSNSENSKRNFGVKGKAQENLELSKAEVEMLIGRLGIACEADDDMQMGSKEMCKIFEDNEPSVEEVKAAFDVFDENRDGFIDVAELQRVLCVLGVPQGSKVEECEKMITAYDQNRDGVIDFNEFVKLMESSFC